MYKNARKGDGLMAVEPGREKVAYNIGRSEPLATPAADLRRSIAIRADLKRSAAEALSRHRGKGFGTALAAKRIFHIGNAMKAPTVP
jgi:hypothetical protein